MGMLLRTRSRLNMPLTTPRSLIRSCQLLSAHVQRPRPHTIRQRLKPPHPRRWRDIILLLFPLGRRLLLLPSTPQRTRRRHTRSIQPHNPRTRRPRPGSPGTRRHSLPPPPPERQWTPPPRRRRRLIQPHEPPPAASLLLPMLRRRRRAFHHGRLIPEQRFHLGAEFHGRHGDLVVGAVAHGEGPWLRQWGVVHRGGSSEGRAAAEVGARCWAAHVVTGEVG